MNTQTKLGIAGIIMLVPLVSILMYGSSDGDHVGTDSTRLVVIASFYPLFTFAENIGQERIDLTFLVPAGIEPHDWEPTIKDVQNMQNADIILINGIGFEDWVGEFKENTRAGIIVDTSSGILRSDNDPHVWLNPAFAKIQVQNIADAFSTSDPQNQDFYQSNANSYIKQLDALDQRIKTELEPCSRDFFTLHDAFSHFAGQYQLRQHPIIPSNDPHVEAGARSLQNTITLARQLDARVIFSDSAESSRISQTIADEIGARVLVLSPIEVASNEDYISKMTENLANLKEALC